MNRRELLIGAAMLAGAGQANAFGIGKLGANFGRGGSLGGARGVPAWVLAGAAVDMDFANGRYYGGTLANLLPISRASSRTNLLPSSASGFAYSTFLSNVPAITPGSGILPEDARTNIFLNSTAPATQTITLPSTGSYALWVNGSGSAAVAAGTATITGAGTATNGTPVVINCTVVGSVVVTITGALNACQLEKGTYGTSLIVTAGSAAARATELLQVAGAGLSIFGGSAYSALISANDSPNSTTNAALLTNVAGDYFLYYNNSIPTVLHSFQTSGSHDLMLSGVPSYRAAATKSIVMTDASGRSSSAGNVSPASDAFTFGSNASVYLGSQAGNNSWSEYISRMTLFSSRLSSAAGQALTA